MLTQFITDVVYHHPNGNSTKQESKLILPLKKSLWQWCAETSSH